MLWILRTAFGIRVNIPKLNVYGKDISRIEGVAIKDFSEMDKILPMCDVISIHLPLTPQTRGLFNKEMFGYLHPNTLLINTSRAEIIDEEAMLEAIKETNIGRGHFPASTIEKYLRHSSYRRIDRTSAECCCR